MTDGQLLSAIGYPQMTTPPTIEASIQPTAEENALVLLWRDRALQVLHALALLANLALFGYLALRFEVLPDPLPLHFDAAGLPDRIEAKTGVFGLPIIGFTVFALNTALGILAHRHERAATMLLAASALLVQVLMWVALVNIAGGLY
jgi:uncharacterized membrane protein